jgi:putative NADH-flavin reductase
MHLALFGATGRVGGRALEYALAEGHTVTALVRDAAKLVPRSGLTIVGGDVLDPASVAQTMRGADAVISTLGNAGLQAPGTAVSEGMRNIAQAMLDAGVTRVLSVAGGGILDSPNGGLRQEQPTFPAIFRFTSAQHRGGWEALRDTTLEWTIACTGDIVPGARTGAYRVLDDFLPEGGRRISVEDVADFLLGELATGAHLRKRVGLGY